MIRNEERAAYAAGDILALPSIIGTNADEGSKLTAAWQVKDKAALDALIVESFGQSAARARALYAADEVADVRESVAAMFADTQFNNGARGAARGLSAKGAPVYRYLFLRRRPDCGAPNHGDEVPYVFASLAAAAAIEPGPFDKDDETLAEAIQDAWVRFAATGDPNGGRLPHWSACGRDEPYLELDQIMRVGSGWREADSIFWTRSLPPSAELKSLIRLDFGAGSGRSAA